MSPAKQSVLVIQEDEEITHLVQFLLEREGFAVTPLADGRQAEIRIKDGLPADVVLLGVRLPYLDGFHLLRLLKSQDRWKQVPVLMLTYDAREEDIVQALEMGADDYILKPFNPREMIARVRRRLRSPHDAADLH